MATTKVAGNHTKFKAKLKKLARWQNDFRKFAKTTLKLYKFSYTLGVNN